jgi:polysaccharide deacetylase family protein (PEP-CTERM system associated)
MEPESFRDDLRRSSDVLSGITGRKVTGYRAASWSLMRNNLWALDIMAELGLTYDSSMFPTSLHAYGMPNGPRSPVMIRLGSGKSIAEFPAQVLKIGPLRIPAAGGFYLRAFPQLVSNLALRQAERNGTSGMVYLHPYDLDTGVPRLKVPFVFRVIRYYNLKSTFSRLQSLLETFRFSSIQGILGMMPVSEIDISSLRGPR